MVQWMLDTNNQNNPTHTRYILLHIGSREFFPASPRQLHSTLYRTIIGEPGRNEDDLSHCPLVSGSLGAPIVAGVSNVSAHWSLRWLDSSQRVQPCWLQPHSVAIGLHSPLWCPAPQYLLHKSRLSAHLCRQLRQVCRAADTEAAHLCKCPGGCFVPNITGRLFGGQGDNPGLCDNVAMTCDEVHCNASLSQPTRFPGVWNADIDMPQASTPSLRYRYISDT